MRDTTLLRDIILYLKNGDAPLPGFGRFQKTLLKRLDREIAQDPLEIYRLSSTFMRLFDHPATDCQPSKSWQSLADKMRFALNKKRKANEEDDALVAGLIYSLLEQNTKPEKDHGRHYPFRKTDRKLKFSLKKR